jgi:hypothetical protein
MGADYSMLSAKIQDLRQCIATYIEVNASIPGMNNYTLMATLQEQSP